MFMAIWALIWRGLSSGNKPSGQVVCTRRSCSVNLRTRTAAFWTNVFVTAQLRTCPPTWAEVRKQRTTGLRCTGCCSFLFSPLDARYRSATGAEVFGVLPLGLGPLPPRRCTPEGACGMAPHMGSPPRSGRLQWRGPVLRSACIHRARRPGLRPVAAGWHQHWQAHLVPIPFSLERAGCSRRFESGKSPSFLASGWPGLALPYFPVGVDICVWRWPQVKGPLSPGSGLHSLLLYAVGVVSTPARRVASPTLTSPELAGNSLRSEEPA